MTIDPSISIGQMFIILSVVTSAVAGFVTVKVRICSLERTVEQRLSALDHTFDKFGERLDKHEETIKSIIGDIQRVIGRLEESDRRPPPNRGN